MTTSNRKSHLAVRALCEGGIMLAAAFVLSMLQFWKMYDGGGIDFGMLPILLFAVRWGVGPGLVVGFADGVLQFMQAGGIAIGWQSIIGDYLVAFTVLGLAGLFRGWKRGIFVGTVVGCVARFLVHYIVGATIWAEYMPDLFFGMTMTSPWFYSLLYNGFYMAIDMVLCLVVFGVLSGTLGKYFRAEDIRPVKN